MTKEPFDIKKEAERLWSNLIDHMNVETKHAYQNSDCSEVSHILEYARLCFSQGREQGIEEAAQKCDADYHGWLKMKDGAQERSYAAEASRLSFQIRFLKSKEVSGKEGK